MHGGLAHCWRIPPTHCRVDISWSSHTLIGSHAHAVGSRAYVEYGLADKFTVGAIPIIGYNMVSNGTSSSGIQWGDLVC
jgi:hypothetical protein